MARFVTNMERQDCKKRFKDEKKTLMNADLRSVPKEEIEAHVEASMLALKDLLRCSTIDMER